MKREFPFKSYKEFFSYRVKEIAVSLRNRPTITIFYTQDFDDRRKRSLITLYNLNLKILKIFDETNYQPYL